jgi:protein dithiol:quinone oxidoreductase
VLKHRRLVNFLGFLACFGLIAYALYTQYDLGYDACPLCIFQRIGIMALGFVFLIAGVHNPRGWGGRVYAVLIGLAALATIGVAARHLYIQSLPPGSIPSCGAPLTVLWKFTPTFELIRKVLSGSGECSQVDKVLGLPMPAWVLIWAAFLGYLGIATNTRRRLSTPAKTPLFAGRPD